MAYSSHLLGGAWQIPKQTFIGDFSVTLKSTQIANGRFFFGGDTTSGSLEVYRNNGGKIALYIGTIGYFSGTSSLSNNVDIPDVIVVSRAGAVISVYLNDVLQGTATFSGSVHISWIGLRSGWSNYPAPMRLYSFETVDVATPSNGRKYNPSLSNGAGDILPTENGLFPGTQFNGWPADNSEWVYYEPPTVSTTYTIAVGNSNQVSVAPTITVSETFNQLVPAAGQQSATSAPVVSVLQTLAVVSSWQSSSPSSIHCNVTQHLNINSGYSAQSPSTVALNVIQGVLVPPSYGVSAVGAISITQSSPDSQLISVPASGQQAAASNLAVTLNQFVLIQPVEQLSIASPIALTITTASQITVPDIELNPRKISIELTTLRPRVFLTTQLYSIELTTPRYSVIRG